MADATWSLNLLMIMPPSSPPIFCVLSPFVYRTVLTFLNIDTFSSYKETSLSRMTINGHPDNKEV
jgi:hypothetical protein